MSPAMMRIARKAAVADRARAVLAQVAVTTIATSMSNGDGFSERMIASKKTLLERLESGRYRFAAPGATEGLIAFLGLSLAAEAAYPMALAERPGLLFEDHLEPMLGAYRARVKGD